VEDPEEDQAIDARRLEEDLLGADLPVLYVLGNDDLVAFEPPDQRFMPLHGRRVELGGFNFVGYQYSPPWMGGPWEKPDEEILVDLEELKGYLDPRTVLVTHSPAHGFLDPGFGGKKIGSCSLRKLLDSHPVRAHIHGHSHAGFGRADIHFNVASALSKRAMLLDLENLHHEILRG
jgi:Icc-related predicted phosphoesterase